MKKTVLSEENVREIVREELHILVSKLEIKLVETIKNPIMETLDSFIKEIRDSRDEQTLLADKQSEHSDQLEHHEIRLTTMEEQLLKN